MPPSCMIVSYRVQQGYTRRRRQPSPANAQAMPRYSSSDAPRRRFEGANMVDKNEEKTYNGGCEAGTG